MDYFVFDLQLFGSVTFPTDGHYPTTADSGFTGEIDTSAGTDTPEDGKCYLKITGGAWSIVRHNGEADEPFVFEGEISLINLAGTDAENFQMVEIPSSIGGWQGTEKKLTCNTVGSFVSVSNLADGATVETKLELNNAAITVNGVAFTGVKSSSVNTQIVTFTVNGNTVSAALGVSETAVTAPAGIDVSVGTTTYTALAGGATIANSAENLGSLTAGSVDLGQNEAIVTTKGTITNKAEAGIAVTASGGVTPDSEKAVNYTVALIAGQEVTDGTYTYKGATSAVVTVSGAAGARPSYALTSGSVTVEKGKKTLANGNIIENTATEAETNTITVDKDGNVTEIATNGIASVEMPKDGATTIGGVTYTNAGADDATATITATATATTLSEGIVTLNGGGVADKTLTVGTDFTVTHTTDTGKTVTISSAGVVSAIGDGATVAVQADEEKTIKIGTLEYTTAGASTKLTATALDAVTLTSGSVELDKGESIVTTIGTITNNADDAITVASTGAVTPKSGKAVDYTVALKDDQALTVNEKVYTNAGSAVVNVTRTSGETFDVALTAGSVVVPKDGVITAGGNTITNNATEAETNTITVDKDGNVTNIATNGIAQVEMPMGGKTAITISGDATTYTNAGESGATIVATASASKLTEGTVSFAKEGGAIVWGDQGVTITNNVADKATIVNTTNGVTGVAADGRCTVDLGNVANNAIKINNVEYKNAAAAPATLEVTKSGEALAAEVKSGSVKVPAGQDITANGTVITSGLEGDALITVASTGAVSGIETAGSKITVKKAGATATSTYEVKATGDDNTRDIYVTGAVIGVYDEVTVEGMTVTFTDGAAAVAVSGTPKAAASVEVTYDGENKYNFYALKDAGGTLTAVGAATAETAAAVEGAIGYFQFANAEGAETVTFHDLGGNAALTLGAVTINVGALKDITAINVTGVSAVTNGVTLSNLSATVQEDAIAGTNNYTYAPFNVLADDATITLPTGAEASTVYYKLKSPTTEHGKTVYDIEATTDEGEIAAGNVFKVVTTAKTEASPSTVTITYEPAAEGAINFNADHSTLTVNAAAAAEDAQITLSGTTVKNLVQKAKGSVTVVDATEKTTVSYFTTFAWAAGTYLIPVGTENKTVATGVESGDTVATGKYNKIAVTEATTGKFTIAITGVMGDMTPTTTTDITKVTATASVTELDATAIGVTGATIDGLQSGTTVTLAGTDDATILSGTTTLTVKKGEATPITYEATGALTVRADGKATAGAFALSTASGKISSLTGTKTFTTGDVATATVAWTKETGTAAATVTFEEGAVATITGLDEVGEKVTVTKYEGTPATEKVYTYEVDSAETASTIVWKQTDPSDKVTYIGGQTAASDVLAGGLDWTAPTMIDAAFSWADADPDTAYYFTAGASTAEEKHGVRAIASGKGDEAAKNTVYIKATVSAESAGVRTLTLTAVKGTAIHGVTDEDVTSSGSTFTVDADGAGAIFYEKEVGKFAGTLVMANVAKNSVITGMGTNDTVDTAKFAVGDKVTIGSVNYVAAAADKALSFKDNALTAGVVTVSDTALSVADGSSVTASGIKYADAVMTVADGKISTITGLEKGEVVEVVKGTVTTTYTAHSDTIIWMTVEDSDAPSDPEKNYTKATKITAGADVIKGGEGDDKYTAVVTTNEKSYAWAADDVANFLVTAGKATVVATTSKIDHTKEGQTYVQVKLATDGTLTLQEGTVSWTGALGTAGAISKATYDIAMTIPGEGKKVILATRPDTSGKITISGVAAGSDINLNGAKDTVTTVELGTADTDKVTIGGVVYKSAKTSNALTFTANKLTEGAVALGGTEETETTLSGGEIVKVSANGSVVLTADDGKIDSITGLDAEGETVTVTSGKTVTKFVYEKAGYAKKTVTVNGTEVVTDKEVKLGTGNDVMNALEVAGYPQKFDWSDATAGATFYVAVDDTDPDAQTANVAKNTTETDLEVKNGQFVIEATATATDGVVELTLTPKKYNGTTLVALTETEAAELTAITITGADAGTAIKYTDTTGATVTVTNAAAGSVFTDLAEGSTVTSIASLAKDAVIKVNGEAYQASTAGTQIVAVAAWTGANIVSGAVTVTGTITSSTALDTDVISTLTFEGEGKDGVQVVYGTGDDAGKIQSIKDLEVGEKVTLEDASTGVKKEYTAVVKDEDELTVTRITTTPSEGTRQTDTYDVTITEGVPGDIYAPVGAPQKLEVCSGFGGTNSTCYALIKGAGTEAEPYSATIPKAEAGEWTTLTGEETQLFVKAVVNGSGALTLTKVRAANATTAPSTVVDDGKLTGIHISIDAEGEKVSLADRNYAAAVTVTNVGADSTILATGWGEGDKVTTAALDENEEITVGGETFRAGADGTKLEIVNEGDGAEYAVKNGAVVIRDYILPSLVATSKSGETVTKYTVAVTSGNAVVTVTDGVVTGLANLNYTAPVTVTKQVGTADPTMTTYTATYDDGYLTKSEVVSGDYKNEKRIAYNPNADQSLNVLGDNVKWTASNVVTKLDFGWNSEETTGYFHLSEGVHDQTGSVTYIDGKPAHGNVGETLLKVKATTTASVAAISEISFVKVQPNGSLAETVAPSSLSAITIDATGLKGVTLPDHTLGVNIINAAPGTAEAPNNFFGLNDADTVSGSAAGTFTLTRTVNKKDQKSTFTTQAGDFTVTGAGTITKGIFTVIGSEKDATATGSAVCDAESNPTAAKEIIVAKGSSVDVTFNNGEIASVTGLDDKETVVINGYQYVAKTKKEAVYQTTTITRDGSNITKTVTNEAEWGKGVSVVMTREAADVNVFQQVGYKMKNPFTYGKTMDGAVGLFLVDETGDPNWTAAIAEQSSTPTLEITAGKHYVMVGAGKDKNGNITVSYLQAFTCGTSNFTPYDTASESSKLKTIGLALASGDGDVTFAVSDERTYAINVTGAQAKKSYIGFAAQDTVNATLASGDTITVGSTAKKKTTFTAGEDSDAVAISGEGKAIGGVFAVGAGFETIGSDKKTAKVTGVKTAIVTVENGAVTSLKGLAAGQTVTVVSTNASGQITTDVYKAAKGSDSDHLTITRTRTLDGVTQNETATVAVGGEVISGVEYGNAANGSVNSTFDWTFAKGSGYFKTDITTEKPNTLGDLTVKTATTKITNKNKGETYLKVTLSDNGAVSAMTLHTVNADGTLSDALAWAGKAGTLTIAAPSATKLTFDRATVAAGSALPAGVAVTVTDAITGSAITGLQAGDVVSTSKLLKDDTIDVNGETYTAAAADVFTLKITDAGAKLSDGTLKVTAGGETETVKTTKGQYVVAAGASANVKVLNGEVVSISGQTGDVTVTDGLGNVAVYNTAGNVNYTTLQNGTLTTAAMEAGKTVTIDTKNYTVGEGGSMKLFVDTSKGDGSKAKVVEGTLSLAANTSVVLTKDGTTDTTVAAAAGNTGTAIVKVVNGVVTSITGLTTNNDSVTVTVGGVATTYTRIDANTVSKKVGTADAVTAFLTDGNVVDAKYLEANAAVDTDDEAYMGQFSWVNIDGRSTGYFALNAKNQATIAEQAKKVTIGEGLKGKATAVKTQVYAVANAVDDGAGNQVLTISGAVQAENNGTATTIKSVSADLLNGATLTVTAPTAALHYTKLAADKFNIALNTVQATSTITGLVAGDTLKTAALAANVDTVTVDGKVYKAGAKGALEFLGEGSATGTHNITLRNGTIALADDVEYLLSGKGDTAATNSLANNITVVADIKGVAEVPVVTVKNGEVTSITGLTTANTTVTVTAGGTPVVYKVLYSEAVWNKAGTEILYYNTMVERTEGEGKNAKKTYASFTSLKSVYATSSVNKKGETVVTNGYKVAGADTEVNTDKLWQEVKDAKNRAVSTTVYVESDAVNGLKETDAATATLNKIVASTAERGKTYLAATVKTTNGVTTIQKIEVVQINAIGVPTVVKNGIADLFGAWNPVKIDGTLEAGGIAKINYTIPKDTVVNITEAALGSTFSGVKTADLIDTAVTEDYELAKGTVTIYDSSTGTTLTRKVTYAPAKNDITTATISTNAAGEITKLTGLDTANESVTLVEQTDDGEITTIYAVSKDGKTLTKTTTAADGQKTVATATLADVTAATYDWAADSSNLLVTDNPEDRVTVSEFDWTMLKKPVGYFAVTTARGGATSAAVKAQTKAVTISPYTNKAKGTRNTGTYLAVSISDDGELQSIEQVAFDSDKNSDTYNTLVAKEDKFTGTINVTAPATVLTFDRSKVDAATIADTATVAITNAAANSNISNLKTGDKVTTAKLTYANGLGQGVGIDGDFYSVGAAGALSFLVQNVNDEAKVTVTGGTVALSQWGGMSSAYIGTKRVTATEGDVNVAVSKNGAAYTVSGLNEGEKFTVEYEDGTTKTFEVSAAAVFCTTTKGDAAPVTSVHAVSLGTKGASLASGVLDVAEQDKKSGWTVYNDANLAFKADNTLVSGKAVTVDLAQADKRIKADGAHLANSFVIDKYMAAPAKFAGAASVINTANALDVQQVVGGNAVGTYTYTATATIAQTIKATNGWTVVGSNLNDIITGAAKGADVLRGRQGNDTLTGGGANDTFIFADGDGNDVVKSYTSYVESTDKGDKLNIGYFALDADHVNLAGTALDSNGKTVLKGVSLHDADDSVLLVGVAGKAVNINGGTYYFGDGTKTKGAATFTYVENASYYANAALTNTLKVTTDKTKATSTSLGNTVEIDLNADAAKYINIGAIDGSASANRMILTAGDNGSTLKGGTYQSTLKAGSGKDSLVGGSGADVFWFDNVEKADAVSGYASGKDSFYFGNATGSTADEINGMTIKASGNDVVITNSDAGSVTIQKAVNAAKAVTILADETGTEKLSYYVGKAGTAAKLASNTFTATIGKEAEVKDTEDKDISLKTNYYVGNDTATDTLKVVNADKKNALTAKVSLADLADNLSSIDTLDASGLTKVTGSKITIEGKAAGTFTLIGYKNTAKVAATETFDLKNLDTAGATVTVTNLDVSDVLEIAAGATANFDAAKKIATLKWDDGSTITFSGIKTDLATAFGTTADALKAGGKFTRTK